MKSGKYTLGYKTVLRTIRSSKGLHPCPYLCMKPCCLLTMALDSVLGFILYFLHFSVFRSVKIQGSLLFYRITAPLCVNPKLSTTQCLPKLEFTTITEVSFVGTLLSYLVIYLSKLQPRIFCFIAFWCFVCSI